MSFSVVPCLLDGVQSSWLPGKVTGAPVTQHRLPAACARRYFDYINFNATGYRPYVTTLYAVLLGCLRKALARMLVLIVAMGFGVVLPYLGAVQKKARLPRQPRLALPA